MVKGLPDGSINNRIREHRVADEEATRDAFDDGVLDVSAPQPFRKVREQYGDHILRFWQAVNAVQKEG